MALVPDYFRTNFAKYEENPVITNYKKVAMDMLHLNFPLAQEWELAAAIDASISNHIRDTNITIDNNYKKRTINQTLLGMARYIIEKEPIITSYGVLYSRHGTVPNPLYNMIDGFINGRKAMKKEMFKYPKGSEEFEKYNLLQLLLKIDANGYYGVK